ncbi:MAG: PKD domain-containing protein [Candidatus Thermoplasmatota archaeon]|nr:PKD domain-containing protein [Candidatus Thermoplasmatota archaeon]
MLGGGASMRRAVAMLAVLLASLALPGCMEALDLTVNPKAELDVYPAVIQEGEMVTLDARTSDAVEGVLTEYIWDFGDGTTATTVIGFTSHRYTAFGIYTVSVTVVNDQGGEDESSSLVTVNGAPNIVLDVPALIRSGDTALLDASASTDPEGAPLSFVWDLNLAVDSDGNGQPEDDADAITPDVLVPTDTSGLIRGRLTVEDTDGGVVTEDFELNVTARRFSLTWVEETVTVSWDGYLDQGDRWEENHIPGEGVRVMAYEALLELDQDVLVPADNFTLVLEVPADGYTNKAQTTPGNITQNTPASAEISDDALNPTPEDAVYEGNSANEVLSRVLNQPGARFGQGNWTWAVIADQSDPDGIIPGAPDPDPGNDWTLEVRITVLSPRLVEIAYE